MNPWISKHSISPFLGIAFGILAASTSSIFIRFAQETAPSVSIAALRLIFATAILSPFALKLRWQELIHLTHTQVLLMIGSGFLLALHFATWISSLEFTSVASSIVLVTTSPVWVALLSPVFLKESLKRHSIIGLVVAMAGSLVVALAQNCHVGMDGSICDAFIESPSGTVMWGNFLALAGAWCAAGYFLIGRKLRSSTSLLSYAFGVYGIAALVLAGFSLILRQNLADFPPSVYGWCLLLALFPQILGHTSFNWALKYVSANFVSLALLGEPVASVILAVIFLYETPTILEIVGGATILAGIYLASRQD